MKQKWSRRTCMVLCLLMLLSCALLSACTGPIEPPVYDNRLNFLSNKGVSIYRIVCPMEGCTAQVSEAASRLQEAMQYMLGTEVILTDDRGTANAADQLQPYEILIGETARTESQAVLPELRRDEYVIRVVGHKIVIVGQSNRATAEAVDDFIANVLGYSQGVDAPEDALSQMKIEKNYDKKGKYECLQVPNEGGDMTLPAAPYRATLLNVVTAPENAHDRLTLATLQGLSTQYGSEQIFILNEGQDAILQDITAGGVTLMPHNDDGILWSLETLLAYYSEHVYGYILCSSDLSSESAQVAVNLAHQLNAVVVASENELTAMSAGLSMILDVRDKDDAWLRSSEYFALLDHKVSIEPDADCELALADYVVMTGCYYYDYRGIDEYTHVQTFKHMERGGYLLSVAHDDKHHHVLFDAIGVTAIAFPDAHEVNLSVLSAFIPQQIQDALFP